MVGGRGISCENPLGASGGCSPRFSEQRPGQPRVPRQKPPASFDSTAREIPSLDRRGPSGPCASTRARAREDDGPRCDRMAPRRADAPGARRPSGSSSCTTRASMSGRALIQSRAAPTLPASSTPKARLIPATSSDVTQRPDPPAARAAAAPRPFPSSSYPPFRLPITTLGGADFESRQAREPVQASRRLPFSSDTSRLSARLRNATRGRSPARA